MKVCSGKQGEKGFTMLEVLVTVAILAVLLAIATPEVVRLSRNLKMTELDDIAREIYVSAQSRAISLSVSGQLSQVGGEAAKTPDPAPATPLAVGDPAPAVQYVYVTNADDSPTGQIGMLLPRGSIDETVRQNRYIIEYNPVTATVAGVYYWENADSHFAKDSTDGYGKEPTRENRMKYSGGMVGYYNGQKEDPSKLPPFEGTSSLEVELVNGEELYLKIKPAVRESVVLDGMITVTLTDLDAEPGVNNTQQIAYFNNSDRTGVSDDRVAYGTNEYRVTLDSLRAGLRFSELNLDRLGDAFHPGCELKVTVTFQEEGKQTWSREFLTNSLFASVEGDWTANDRTAYIACGRHLENLGLRFVYPTGSIDLDDNLHGVKSAVQTKDIDWADSVKKLKDDLTAFMMPISLADAVPTSFTPIVNDNLKGVDGKGNKISHVDIFGSVQDELEYGVGLFSKFVGDFIRNVNLVDCTIYGLTGGTSENVGLLAGAIDLSDASKKVFNCRAYATKDAGGNFNCSINAPTSTNAGGLFGSVKDATMENCSASLTKLAGGTGTYVGGLAGASEGNVTISKCYADTGVRKDAGWLSGLSGQTVGGLVGIAGGTSFSMTESYAVGYVSNDGVTPAACGLVGAGSAGSVVKCYAAVVNESSNIGNLVPADITATDCISYTGSYHAFDSLVGSPYTKNNTGATHAYGMPDASPVYPFPRIEGMPHYGDWPSEGLPMIPMAYYEVYKKGGDYSIGFFNAAITDEAYGDYGLKNEEEYKILMDGYAVLLPAAYKEYNPANLTVEYKGDPIDKSNLMKASVKFKSAWSIPDVITLNGAEYCPLFLSSKMMIEEAEASPVDYHYYQQLEVTVTDGASAVFSLNAYFNPYVAKSSFAPGTEARPGTSPLSILRTSRQVTAYSYDTMQKTAAGKYAGKDEPENATHTLRLERNISLDGKFMVDSVLPTTPDQVKCKNLIISGADSNVILELNGKTLTGRGDTECATVTSRGGKLEIRGAGGSIKGGKEITDADGKVTVHSIDGAGDVTVTGLQG